MKTKHQAILTVIGVATILLVAFIYFKNTKFTPVGNPGPLLFDKVTSLGTEDMNITQGQTLQLNITIRSYKNQKLTIPLSNVNLKVPNTDDYISIEPENNLIKYHFRDNQLILEPNGFNSTILTLNPEELTPIGKYRFLIDIGEFVVDATYHESIFFTVIVNPKS